MTLARLRLPLLLALVFVGATSAHAATYTRTMDASDVGKYSLDSISPLGSCYDLTADVFADQAACQQAAASRGGTILSNCAQVNKTTYTYTFPGTACQDSIDAYGLVLVGGGSTGSPTSPPAGGGGGSTGSPTDVSGGGGGSTGSPTDDGSVGSPTGGDSAGKLQNPLKFNDLPSLIDAILNVVVQLGAALLVFMLVWVGLLFVTARGNPEEISKARSALMWTVIGGLILLGAEAISKVIQATASAL